MFEYRSTRDALQVRRRLTRKFEILEGIDDDLVCSCSSVETFADPEKRRDLTGSNCKNREEDKHQGSSPPKNGEVRHLLLMAEPVMNPDTAG